MIYESVSPPPPPPPTTSRERVASTSLARIRATLIGDKRWLRSRPDRRKAPRLFSRRNELIIAGITRSRPRADSREMSRAKCQDVAFDFAYSRLTPSTSANLSIYKLETERARSRRDRLCGKIPVIARETALSRRLSRGSDRIVS